MSDQPSHNETRPAEPRDSDREAAETQGTVSRRRALQVLAAGTAAAAALPSLACAPDTAGGEGGTTDPPGEGVPPPPEGGNPLARGTPTDPDLIRPEVWWDLQLETTELATLAVLCDVILPADDRSPAASDVGAPEFIDEWVSAPYDGNREDLILVRGGLVWLDTESNRRFGAGFRDIEPEQRDAICGDIAYLETSAPQLRAAARFFDRVRDLASTAFWTSEAGMADLGFVGNQPMPDFPGPPAEVLDRLGLTEEATRDADPA